MILLDTIARFTNWAKTVIGNFWKAFTNKIRQIADKVAKKLARPVMGISSYFRKTGDQIQDRTRYYSKNELGRWKETIVTRNLAEDELPDEYNSRLVLDQDINLSEELELAMR